MKYNTLLFDADDTLLDFAKAEHEGLTKAFEEMDIPLSESLRSEYVELNKMLWEQLNKGKLTREQILDTRFGILFERHGIKKDGHRTEELYRSHLNEGFFLIEGALELIKELSKSRRIYIVTNGCKKTQDNRLLKSGLSQYLSDVFVSEAVGANKPSIVFFDYVKKHIPDFSEKDTLIIGDSPSSDIQGGINAGIDTCLFDRENKGCPENIKPTYTINRLEDLYGII